MNILTFSKKCFKSIFDLNSILLLATFFLSLILSLFLYLVQIDYFLDYFTNLLKKEVYVTSAIILVSYFCSGLLSSMLSGLLDIHFHNLKNYLQKSLTINIFSVKYSDFLKKTKGSLQSVYAKDTHVVSQYVTKEIFYSLYHMIKLFFTSAIIIHIDYRGLVFLLALVSILFGVKLYITRNINKVVPWMYEKYDDCASLFTQCVDHFSSIKLAGVDRYFTNKADSTHKLMASIIKKLYSLSMLRGVTGNLLGLVGLSFLLYISLKSSDSSMVTSAKIISLFIVSKDFFESSSFLANTFSEYKRISLSLSRIIQLTEANYDYKVNLDARNKLPKIKLENLSYSYDNKNLIYDDFSIMFEGNKLFVLSGRSGSGKSTLLNLIAGLYQPESGKIIYSGDLDSFNRSFISQKPFIINGSIKENILLGQKETKESLKLIDDALQKVNLAKELKDNNFDLDTKLDDHMNGLSGGQLQRLELVRAMIQKSRYVFLDEPTSALDMESKLKTIKAIKEISKNSLVVVATHDKYLMSEADILLDVESLSDRS